jgi:hypothetical protein
MKMGGNTPNSKQALSNRGNDDDDDKFSSNMASENIS